MATIRVAESGVPVDLFSIVPVKRSAFGLRAGPASTQRKSEGRRRHDGETF